MAKDSGKVLIHGREYSTVAYRVNKFREEHKLDYSIETILVDANDKTVTMKAIISNKDGFIIATGYAEEQRQSSVINKTSALENCETSAIGRALAAFGMAGTEYASADEVANAISQQKAPQKKFIPATPEQKMEIKTLLALEGIETAEMPALLEKHYDINVEHPMTLEQAVYIIDDLHKERP